MKASTASQIKKHHTYYNKQQVKCLALEILFSKHHCTEEERNHYTTSTNHRDNRNHGIFQTQGVEIHEIGCREEERDENNRPMPMKRCRSMTFRPPKQKQHRSHHQALIYVVPRLHHHSIQADTSVGNGSHQILVVQSADRTHHGCSHDGKHPTVVLEIDAFLLATSAQQEHGENGSQHPYPLI